MTIFLWVLFISSLAFVIGGAWFWFTGRKEWEKEEQIASVAQTLLREAKTYNDEAAKSLIDAAKLLDDAKKHLEAAKKLIEKRRNSESVKIVNSDPRVESGETGYSDAGFDPSP